MQWPVSGENHAADRGVWDDGMRVYSPSEGVGVV
jgi:hypothetical protein